MVIKKMNDINKIEKNVKEDVNWGLHDKISVNKKGKKPKKSMAGSLKKYFKNKSGVVSREDILKDLREKNDRF